MIHPMTFSILGKESLLPDGKRYTMDFHYYINSIIKSTCTYFKVSVQEVKSKDRRAKIALCRHMAVFLIFYFTRLTKTEIGLFFNRNHSSVVHIHKKISGYISIGDKNILYHLKNLLKEDEYKSIIDTYERKRIIRPDYSDFRSQRTTKKSLNPKFEEK